MALGGAGMSVAQMYVLLRANTSQHDSALARATASQLTWAKKAQSIGKAGMYSITLPLAMIATAAIKTALEFDKSMTKIAALVGMPAGPMRDLEASIRTLSSTTAQTQTELAEAAYFIASSGYTSFAKGSAGLEILRVSAKGAAIGLGEVKDVADLLTSVLNAYGAENISATEATDQLVVAIREGKAEPDAFARSLGRGLAQAQAAGVEFHELASTISAMSMSGISAQRGTTAFIAMLRDMQKPSKAGAEALAGINMSVGQLNEGISENFLGTLIELKKRFGDNNTAMRDLFKNTVAYNAFLDLTGEKLEKTIQIFADTANAQGDLNRALEETRKSDAFKMEQAITDMTTAIQDLGFALLPTFKVLATGLAMTARGFSMLPEPVQQFAAGALIAVAAAFPLILLGTKIAMAYTAANTAFMAMQLKMIALGGQMGAFKASVMAVTIAIGGMSAAMAAFVVAIPFLIVGFFKIMGAMKDSQEAADAWAGSLQNLLSTGDAPSFIRKMEDVDDLIHKVAKGNSEAWSLFSSRGGIFFKTELDKAGDSLRGYTDQLDYYRNQAFQTEGAAREQNLAMINLIKTQNQLAASAEELYAQGLSEQEVRAALVDQYDKVDEAQGRVEASLDGMAGAAATAENDVAALAEQEKAAADAAKIMTGEISKFLGVNEQGWIDWLATITGAIGSFSGVVDKVIEKTKWSSDQIAQEFEDQYTSMADFVNLMKDLAGKIDPKLWMDLYTKGTEDPKGAATFAEKLLNDKELRRRVNGSIGDLDRLQGKALGMFTQIEKHGFEVFTPFAQGARQNLKRATQDLEELRLKREILQKTGEATPENLRTINNQIDAQRRLITKYRAQSEGLDKYNDYLRDNKDLTGDATGSMGSFSDAMNRANGEGRKLNDHISNINDGMAKLAELNQFTFGFADPGGDGLGILPGVQIPGAPVGAGMGTAGTMAGMAMNAVAGDQVITSAYRPGAVTSSGNKSHHAEWPPAQDIGGDNLMGIARFLLNFAGGIRELIYTPLGFSIKNGQQVDPIAAADHYDHVHIADQGGVFKGPGIVGMGRGQEVFASGLQAAKRVGGLESIKGDVPQMGKRGKVEHHHHGDLTVNVDGGDPEEVVAAIQEYMDRDFQKAGRTGKWRDRSARGN